MQNDVFSKFDVDFEGLGLPRLECHSAAQGSGSLRNDRTHSARRVGNGVAVVALSSPEKCGWRRPGADEIMGARRIGKSVTFHSGVVRHSEWGRLINRGEPLDFDGHQSARC
jgi:hypothetical protein